MKQATKSRVCEGCRKAIENGEAGVVPAFGFGWFHSECWKIEHQQIINEHIEADLRGQLEGGDTQ